MFDILATEEHNVFSLKMNTEESLLQLTHVQFISYKCQNYLSC